MSPTSNATWLNPMSRGLAYSVIASSCASERVGLLTDAETLTPLTNGIQRSRAESAGLARTMSVTRREHPLAAPRCRTARCFCASVDRPSFGRSHLDGAQSRTVVVQARRDGASLDGFLPSGVSGTVSCDVRHRFPWNNR